LSPRLHCAGRRPAPTAVLIPEAGDGSVSQTCSSVLTPPEPTWFRRGSCFQNQNTGISSPNLSRSPNAKSATACFLRRGFLMDFSRDTLFCLHNELSCPGRTAPRAMAANTLRQEWDERIGEYRKNGAGKDRDPLQEVECAVHGVVAGRGLPVTTLAR
jgi:hypothetical protein